MIFILNKQMWQHVLLLTDRFESVQRTYDIVGGFWLICLELISSTFHWIAYNLKRLLLVKFIFQIKIKK